MPPDNYSDDRLPTGEWNGYYLESHRPRRGWMHLYLNFRDGVISGEGTDYVGPWHIRGSYDLRNHQCSWVKQYLGKHQVDYHGTIGNEGIMGNWFIASFTGEFHIWPRSMGYLNELYLQNDLEMGIDNPVPSMKLGTVPWDPIPAEALQDQV